MPGHNMMLRRRSLNWSNHSTTWMQMKGKLLKKSLPLPMTSDVEAPKTVQVCMLFVLVMCDL
ncbi:hypothetical protein PVAP13_6NG089009 [Panicum virgatum]|uniref:Uncharacterized protein n=1 Tax=Panicum virgatum TaxID=38727 RepID=A0A8T0QW30_PANVG|nr:hypothetical protein PVAP13_6NG089009 [Panicum virgatum]